MTPLLTVQELGVDFTLTRRRLLSSRATLTAVDGVSFELARGETLGIVGESGCGKSTLGRAILRLVPPTRGSVHWHGTDLATLDVRRMRRVRRGMQVIFQDPLAALDPRMTIGQIVGEPLSSFEPNLDGNARRDRVETALIAVGLGLEHFNRYPHEFSGGQCQRVAIARAIILEPELILCDEPLAALDVSIQAQILNLLVERRERMGLALLFISHNLSVVRLISHRIAVLYLGRLVELADSTSLFATPHHPYTQALIAAVPIPDPDLERARVRAPLLGEPPSPLDPPGGCAFHPRCAKASARCAAERPVLEPTTAAGWVACHHWRT